MGERDDRYTLEGMVEMDEGYFSIEVSGLAYKTQKAGRGSKTKHNMMLMAESAMLEDLNRGKVERQCRYFKAKVLDDYIYIYIKQKEQTIPLVMLLIMSKEPKKNLKDAHIAISNVKRNFVETYHKIKKKYLLLYLNEFVYKLNRRYFGERIFDRLVITDITGL